MKAKDDTTGFATSDDLTNPFRFEGSREPIKTNGISVNWNEVSLIDRAICMELGKRASALIVAIAQSRPGSIVPPHPAICGMDFAVVHLRRGLDLQAFMNADDLTFTQEFVKIAQHINRRLMTFPADVRLRFEKQRG